MNWLRELLTGDGRTLKIRGGLTLPRNKPGLPVDNNIVSLNVPEHIVIPLLDYHHKPVTPCVRTGQSVSTGDKLAPGIIASTGGTVLTIEDRPVIHPSSLLAPCVVIATRSEQINQQPVHCALDVPSIARIALCGVRGLGGAGFATATKLERSAPLGQPIDTLIINAVECEPGISCDESLLICEATSVVRAMIVMMELTACKRCVLAIENDKLLALAALKQAMQQLSTLSKNIDVQLLAPIYPSGAERPLIERVTHIRLQEGRRPVDQGVVCINVATALAASQAQEGYPLVSRIITVAGEQAVNAVNVRVLFGTPVRNVLEQTGNLQNIKLSRVRVGGPLSGFDLNNLDTPVTATTNCISIEAPLVTNSPDPCIRCDACSEVCPVDLLPQQLYWYAQQDDLDKSTHYGLNQCIECGCCDVVCPSRIPLTQTFRYARSALQEQTQAKQRATDAEQRYQLREQRLSAKAAASEAQRKMAKTTLTQGNDPIAAALARAKQRRNNPDSDNPA